MNRRLLRPFWYSSSVVFLLAVCVAAWIIGYPVGTIEAQQIGYAYRINPLPALPASCLPANGDVVRLTTGNTGIYTCSALNTWTRIDSSAIYNVKAFGAIGNGVVNDRPAIQAAIAAASTGTGGTVIFPAGTYALSTAATGLTIQYSGVELLGLGRATLVAAANLAANPALTIGQAATLVTQNVRIANLSIALTADTSYGIRATNLYNSTFEHVFVTGNNAATTTETGLLFEGAGGGATAANRVRDCTFYQVQYGVVFNGLALRISVSQSNFVGLTPVLAGTSGVYSNGATNIANSINECSFVNWALAISDAGTGSQIIGNAFVANTAALTEQAAAVGYMLLANQFDVDTTVLTSIAGWKFDESGRLYLRPIAQGALGAPANGQVVYCFDCAIGAACAGGGTGAIAKRLAGAWVCN
jgi:hypothetical protein